MVHSDSVVDLAYGHETHLRHREESRVEGFTLLTLQPLQVREVRQHIAYVLLRHSCALGVLYQTQDCGQAVVDSVVRCARLYADFKQQLYQII